jgi:hypothetical protein
VNRIHVDVVIEGEQHDLEITVAVDIRHRGRGRNANAVAATPFLPSPLMSATDGGEAVHCSHMVLFISGQSPVCRW